MDIKIYLRLIYMNTAAQIRTYAAILDMCLNL